jgi:hypothetical protein
MAKYYEVIFYGKVQEGNDLNKVKHLLAQSAGRKADEIDAFYAEPRVVLKKCPTYEYAKKYVALFEKTGAQVHIETAGEDKIKNPADDAKATDSKLAAKMTRGFSSPRHLFSGLILLIMGGGIGFWVASQYFAYQNLSVIVPITAKNPEINAATSETTTPPAPIEGIGEAIKNLEQQIKETEAEDEKYAGGLIKALIGSRLAILKQTHAMLEQRTQASLFRIGIKYTVDGQLFTPPQDASTQLGVAERELAELTTKIALAEAEAARYSGGLVHAISLSTVAQLKQTQAMLDQKRLALQFSLPQYLGFNNIPASPSESNSTKANTSSEAAPPIKKEWRIIEVDSRVTESNNSWWRYAWQLKLANDSQQPMLFDATIEFQDADGFVIDQDTERGLIPAASEKTFTGYKLVSLPGAAKVAKTLAKVGVK